MGQLTTHVLDTMVGRPAAGLKIELYALGGEPRLVRAAFTNSDGRTNGAIAHGDEFAAGWYELRFHAGDYLKKSGVSLSDPPFLDIIPVRFGVADVSAHIHVPLLLSAFGYSTYRGS